MSAIGDYIHYYGINYFKYGVKPTTGEQPSRDISTTRIINKKRKSLRNQLQIEEKDMFKEEYQKQLDYLFGHEGVVTNNQKNEYNSNFKKIVSEVLPDTIINYSTLGVSGNTENIKIKKISLKEERLSFGTIERKIDQLKELFNTASLTSYHSEKEIRKNLQLFKKVVKQEKELLKSIQDSTKNKKGFVEMQKESQSLGYGLDLTKATNAQKSFIADLNKLITFFNGVKKTQAIGVLGEVSAAYAGQVLLGVSAKKTKEAIQKAIVGQNTGAPVYLQANFSNKFVNLEKLGETKGWEYHADKGGYVRAKLETQNKVDVIINLPEDEKTLSVKNYNLSGNSSISIVSGTSFLSLTQNENDDDFMNHYFTVLSIFSKALNKHHFCKCMHHVHLTFCSFQQRLCHFCF